MSELAKLEHAEAQARIDGGDFRGAFSTVHADSVTTRFCRECASVYALDDVPEGTLFRIGVVGPSTFVAPVVVNHRRGVALVRTLLAAHAREVGTIIGVEISTERDWELWTVLPVCQ